MAYQLSDVMGRLNAFRRKAARSSGRVEQKANPIECRFGCLIEQISKSQTTFFTVVPVV